MTKRNMRDVKRALTLAFLKAKRGGLIGLAKTIALRLKSYRDIPGTEQVPDKVNVGEDRVH